ncbi:MAG TPA: IPT/TIG domain-containing protein [Cytophagales bacterium]|nr:IPT/TIG domain-containing protein [Cytophagales bacterium]
MKKSNIARFLTYLFIVSLIIFSCKKDDEENNGSPATEISPEKRVELVTSVNNLLNTLNWEDKAAAYQLIQDHLKTFKEIEEVGYSIEGDNVWARFTDGMDYIIANNQPLGDPVVDIELESPEERKENTSSSNSSARVGLPENNKVYLLNSLGTSFPSAQRGRNVIKRLYDEKGYDVQLLDGTIDNLKTIKNVGTFYFSSHGGFVKTKDGLNVYSVYTSDSVTTANEKKYKKEYGKGKLTIFSASHNLGPDGRVQAETHYGITAKFVEEHMSFTNNAFMYLDMCHSFTEGDFQFAFLKKSNYTGTFFGSTDNVVNADAYATSIYVFDRLLGANYPYDVAKPEYPKQRAFDVPSVFADILKKDLGKSRASDEDPSRFAFLTYREGEGSTTLLRPSIAYLQINELSDFLNISGSFGEDLGAGNREVTIDGVPVEVFSWTEEAIVCKIASSGKGSAGDVIVKVREHKSHPRTLSEWRIPLKYKRPSEGTMMEEMTFHIHIRADLLKYRENAGVDPVTIPNNGFQVLVAKDSKVVYSMGGTANHTFTVGCTHTSTVTWTDLKGEVAFFDPLNGNPLGENFTAQAELSASGITIKAISPGILKKAPSFFLHRSVCDGVPTDNPVNQEIAFAPLPQKFRNINLSFDQNFIIKGDKLEEKAPTRSGLVHGGEVINDPEPIYEMTMEWNSISPAFPPKSNAALRVGK